MAATTASKLIQLRPLYRPSTSGFISIHSFSSSSSSTTPDPNENTPQNNSTSPPSPPKSTPSFSSLFGDVKATLKQQQQGNPQSQTPRSPFSFLSSSSAPNASRSSFKMSSTEEIEKNLAEFRRRSAVPIPSPNGSAPQSAQHFSLEELYKRNVSSSGEESSSDGTRLGRKLTHNDIAESLRNIRINSMKNQNERFGKNKDNMSLSKLKESLNLKPGEPNAGDSRRVIGGTDNLPSSIFGKEMRERGVVGNTDAREEFVRLYSHKDLGEKLKSLRPEKKGDWFSIQELSERLRTLREIDQQEASYSQGEAYLSLRDSLLTLKMEDEKKKKQVPTVDILRHLGRTPSFMLKPPKEHLVEKYFHPDNMSASEKLKLELEKVRDEFKMSVSDCGSARVQVAQLTTKIKHLSTVLQKKDKHSRKGLQGMVQKRKTLLKYLRRTDWESYCFVLSKLGLRDNPDYKN